MENRKADRRVAKTKRAIRNAFVKLLSERDINDVTVKAIADTADINRKTFYNYYGGIYSIVDEIEKDIIVACEKVVDHIDFDKDLKNPYPIFEKISSVITSDMEFFEYLVSIKGNDYFAAKINLIIKEKIKEAINLSSFGLETDFFDIILDYCVSGMISTYRKWFKSGRKIPMEIFAKTIGTLSFYGIDGLINMR